MDIIQTINKNKNKITHDIYILKIYLIIFTDNDNSDKLDYVETIFEGLEERINAYQNNSCESNLNLLENDYLTVTSLLNELKSDVLAKQKIAGVIMLDNMKTEELSLFYEEFIQVYKPYKSIEQASSDIFYHSGLELSNFDMRLIKYIEGLKDVNLKLVPLSFLKEYTTIITISLNNWLMLIKNLKVTLKYLSKENDDVINKLKKEFVKINVYYFIVITGGDI